MTVFKTDEGIWCFKVRVNGKQIKRQSKQWTKKEATEQERRFLNEYCPSPTNINLKQVYKLMMAETSLSIKDSSKDTYDKFFRKLDPISDMPIAELDSKLIKDWQLDVATKCHGESLTKVQTLLRRLIRYAYYNDLIASDKLANFKTISSTKRGKIKKCEFFTKEEYEQLVNSVSDKKDLLMYRLLFYTGCRIGELRALQKKHLTDNKLTIEQAASPDGKKINTPKTDNSFRVVVLDKETLRMLKSYCEDLQPNDFIFSDDGSLPVDTYDKFRKRNEVYCKRAGLSYLHIHGFRHSHVSMLINKGFSAHAIAKRIGDTVTMVNEIYGHLYDNAQDELVESLD